MPSHDPDVLVTGAGPTGLTVACALLLHGVSVRVVDQAAGPAPTSRANILHARGAEVLDRLGAVGTLAERAVSAMLVTMHVGGEPVTTMRFGDPGLGTSRPALVVSQAEIEAELRRRLTELGGAVEWHTPVTAASQDTGGVTVTLDEGRTVRAGWLVGCDGAHSTVRKLASVGFPGAPVTEHFLLADVHADWDRDRSGTAGWYHRDGLFLAMPMREAGGADDRWRMMADVVLADGERLSDDAVVDRLRQLLAERVGRTDVRIKDAAWTSVFRVHRRLADEYRRGRVLLAGDAAHIHSPMGGQGMNTGIGDAENLAWKLALVVDGVATSDLLDTYQRERRPLAADILRGTTAATRLQVGEGVGARFLRDRVLVPLANLPAVQRRLTLAASQLWVTYANGPLGGGPAARLRRRPRPGDRVPDLPCRTATGAPSTLHAELGGRWALLVAGTDDGVGPVVRKWLGDRVVPLTCAEPRGGTAWLVRPDAHLAWRGRTDDEGVGRWLARAFCSVR